MAKMVVKESPSRMRGEDPCLEASCTARRAAWASPRFASMAGRRLVHAEMMLPWWSRRMAAATAKRGLIATSKFALMEPRGGGTRHWGCLCLISRQKNDASP
jgi:hypothetical protein